jgi:uncharacterized protein
VECASALARVEREGLLGRLEASTILDRLDRLRDEWREVQPTQALRQTARRLLRVHELRAADALQLAAAIVAAEGFPVALPFVTFDDRLADAAQLEGFRLSIL